MSISITPLSGPWPAPLSYLLTIDNARVLLDCGSFASPDSHFNAYLKQLADLAPSINLVLLSHPLLKSVGCLPWLRAKCGLRCPVYATLPTRELGRWAIEEWIESRTAQEFNPSRVDKDDKGKRKQTDEDLEIQAQGELYNQLWQLTSEEVVEAFSSINAVRWNQPVHLTGPLKGYTMMAHRSGHTLGGALYTIRPSLSSSLSPASSSSSFLYAPIFNHIKEHHLEGAALLQGAKIDESMRRMGVVVVGAERSQMTNVKRIDRERAFLDLITTTLDNAGSVMIPTDASGRLLELLVLLESHWSYWNLGARFPLVLISRTGKEVVSFIRSLTEWMGGAMRAAGSDRTLLFSNLRIYSSIAEANASIPSHVPKCILASPLSLSYGSSRTLLVDFVRSPSNVLLLTSPGEPGSLGRELFDIWNEAQEDNQKWGRGALGTLLEANEQLAVQIKAKVYLEGDELAEFEAQKAREAAERAEYAAQLERRRRMMQAGDSDSDSDSSDEGDHDDDNNMLVNKTDADEQPAYGVRSKSNVFTGGTGAWDEFLDSSSGTTFDIYVKGSWASREVDGRKRFRMFSVIERKRRVDVFGEAVDVQGWLKRGLDDQTTDPRKAAEAAKRQKTEEKEQDQLDRVEEPPHKFVVQDVQLHILCRMQVIDMEGQSDGRALKTILPQLNPRKIVIVHGSQESVQDLAKACLDIKAMTRDVLTPAAGEALVVGEETKNFTIRLGDSIMSNLRLSRVEDYDVAFVSGIIHVDAESDIPVLERGDAKSALANSSTTDDVSKSSDESKADDTLPPLAPSLFIGDLRLATLRDKLRAIHVPAEFVGEGVLVCGPAPASTFTMPHASTVEEASGSRRGAKRLTASQEDEINQIAGGKVAVRKAAKGQLVMEGPPGETYAVVRQQIYTLHAQAS